MTLYHKIDTVFNRDMEGTKKLIEGNYRNPVIDFCKDLDWVWTDDNIWHSKERGEKCLL